MSPQTTVPTTTDQKPTEHAILVTGDDEERRQLEYARVVERVAIIGDLSKISAEDRVRYYARLCESLGLNPLTQPFAYTVLNNRLVLYAKRDATDQIRSNRKMSIDLLERSEDTERGLYTVTARGHLPDGRTDEATGVVSIKGLSGLELANTLMKAETKAKRRLTLSLAGLGFLDETEIADAGGQQVDVDPETGAIVQQEQAKTSSTGLARLREALNEKADPGLSPRPEQGPPKPDPDERDDSTGNADEPATTPDPATPAPGQETLDLGGPADEDEGMPDIPAKK